jgi:DNA helicase-2/ATP-dependent DNA helicase PcrA
MQHNPAKELAKCERGLVVAPAGCGKTHLIAESVAYAKGKQLILTHTHAGVDALRQKLNALAVPPGKYWITTIDGFALCYANAFPILGHWEFCFPQNNEEWTLLRKSAASVLKFKAPRDIIQATYSGIYVDEYQDCCGSQHAMINSLAEIVPCRIVGDPMQAVYRKLNKNDPLSWKQVTSSFEIVDHLMEPYRWKKGNIELGDWLLEVRQHLEKGEEVALDNAVGKAVRWISSKSIQDQINICYDMCDETGVAVICDWPSRCSSIAEKTQNLFVVFESVECRDLLKYSEEIENTSGIDRVIKVVEFACNCLTGMSICKENLERLANGSTYNPNEPDRVQLWDSMQLVVKNDELKFVGNLLDSIEALQGKHYFKRLELWREMRRAIASHEPDSGKTLKEIAWLIRDFARRNGRNIRYPRIVATPLLIKGLEFNHAIVLDSNQMDTPEELYVAMTRGSLTLTVLSSSEKLKRDKPSWITEN